VSDALQSQWARLAGFIVGYQATWITDIGLKTGLFQEIADADDGITEADLASRLDFDPRYVQLWCRSACVYADDAVRQLSRRGYRARRLEDGFPEWKQAGLPVAVGDGG